MHPTLPPPLSRHPLPIRCGTCGTAATVLLLLLQVDFNDNGRIDYNEFVAATLQIQVR